MNNIIRRIEKLEARFGSAAESEQTRWLAARIIAGRQRVAEARARGELGPPVNGPMVEICRRRLLQALGINRGSEPSAPPKQHKRNT